MADPKVWWRGKKFDKTTAQALAEAERLFGKRLVVTQGSFSNGRLSAGTHGGPGAVDLSVRGLGSRLTFTEFALAPLDYLGALAIRLRLSRGVATVYPLTGRIVRHG